MNMNPPKTMRRDDLYDLLDKIIERFVLCRRTEAYDALGRIEYFIFLSFS
jgi:hypothetical protein